MATVHVMTHTHWDREWFLPAEYTNEWLDDLFDRLFEVIEYVPEYRYIFDGQTLIIEDYLKRHPEDFSKIKQKAELRNLLIGPYYGQVDWRAVSEESLMRNLFIGIRDARKYGNLMLYGWILDNFGHCSQSPQIHTIFGIHDVFVWRGPVLENDKITSEFLWKGSDGSQISAHYFMSGYRNFYNLTDTTKYIDLRIDQLKRMLEPFSPHNHIIFLDGYDMDAWPEDPFKFLEGKSDTFIRSTPEKYSEECKIYFAKEQEQNKFYTPTIQGELYSGKYACVFPGSLSARMFLRIENALLERILAYYLEPLQAIVNNTGIETDIDETESLWRALIGTQLHDCLGAVSVDQVHDNMEVTYQRLYSQAQERIADYLEYIPSLLDLQKGKYMFLPSPFEYGPIWLTGNGKTYLVSSNGTGFYQIDQERAVTDGEKEIETYTWKNDFYTFEITKQGITLNGNTVGQFVLEKDAGDTYNADPEPFAEIPTLTITSLRLIEEHEEYAKIALNREISQEDIRISTEEEIFMNKTPVLEWNLAVDSSGTGYRLRFTYDTNNTQSDVFAKMPYDIYQRPRKDSNYFGEDIPQELRPVLLAAREIGSAADFPFQGFVALADAKCTKAIFARGLREYAVDETGKIFVTLRRSVEWLAKSNLRTRVGDAGPYMYLPGARDERKTQFELAFVDINAPVRSPEFLKWFYLFEYGYLLFENASFEGKQAAVRIWEESLPWSGIQIVEPGKSVIRVYNPFEEDFKLSKTYPSTDPFGQSNEEIKSVFQNKIEHLLYEPSSDAYSKTVPSRSDVKIVNFPEWPIGEDLSTVDESILADLRKKITTLKQEQSEAKRSLSALSPEDDELRCHRTKHAVIRLEREIVEMELSILLNELKYQENKAEIQERIRVIGRQLNLVRRQRRTYDYILSVFENKP